MKCKVWRFGRLTVSTSSRWSYPVVGNILLASIVSSLSFLTDFRLPGATIRSGQPTQKVLYAGDTLQCDTGFNLLS